MTISLSAERFSSFKFDHLRVVKIETTILLTAPLIGVGSLEQENKNFVMMGKSGNYLTLETFKLNDNLWQEAAVWEIHRLFLRFYPDLVEKNAGGLCAQSSSLPVKILWSEQVRMIKRIRWMFIMPIAILKSKGIQATRYRY